MGMKTNVKVLAITGAALAAVSVFGCKKAGTDDNKIVIYTHQTMHVLGDELKDENGNTYRDPSTAYEKILAEQFTAETGIEVEFQTIGSEGGVVMQLLQVGDKGIDMFTVGWTITNDEYVKYTQPVMSMAEASDIYGKDFAAAMPNKNGNVYALNIAKEFGEAFTYNETVLKSLGYDGIPQTQAEFEAMLEKIKAKGIVPIALMRVQNWPLFAAAQIATYIRGEPDGFVKMLKDPEPFAVSAPVGKTIKMYADWKARGFFEKEVYPDFGIAMDSVANGKAGMMFFGSWVVQQVVSRIPVGSNNVVKFDAAPDFGKGRFILTNGSQTYAINKASKKAEQCKKYLEYLATHPQYIADIGCIANHKGVESIAPEYFALVQQHIEEGIVQQIVAPPATDNAINNDEILKDINLLADNAWIGLAFDAIDITKATDWTAFDAQLIRQNDAYKKARSERGVSYTE